MEQQHAQSFRKGISCPREGLHSNTFVAKPGWSMCGRSDHPSQQLAAELGWVRGDPGAAEQERRPRAWSAVCPHL
eukprot:scaffold205442_cov21-Tisochrysis_lutea.AAC.2